MKVLAIGIRNTPTFESKEDDFVLGYDDEVSRETREYIRKHYDEDKMPYRSIYEREGRLEEYDLKKLVASLYGKNITQDSLTEIKDIKNLETDKKTPVKVAKPQVDINHELMGTLPLFNVAQIACAETQNSYRGSTPFNNLVSLKIMKDAGIKTVVDLCGFSYGEEECEKQGLNYLDFYHGNMIFYEEAFKNPREYRFIDQKKVRNFIDDFVGFIQTMQQDNVYIGCEYGTYTTDNALMLNHFFNPAFSKGESYADTNKYYLEDLTYLYDNLTSEDKEKMGWTKEFDENFIPRLEKEMDERNIYYKKKAYRRGK